MIADATIAAARGSGMTIPIAIPTPDVLMCVLIVIGWVSLTIASLTLRKTGARELTARIEAMEETLERVEHSVREEFANSRWETNESARLQREESARSMNDFRGSLLDTMAKLSELQKGQLEGFGKQLGDMRNEAVSGAKLAREESAKSLTDFSTQLVERVEQVFRTQNERLDAFSTRLGELQRQSEEKAELLRTTVEQKLDAVRNENAVKLEEMRKTVDEKLHDTLEKRLGESFKQVSDRLEQVHKGLGEMQSLATGVGDLKRVMTNVKTRGTWGEYQLGAILEQVLSPEQYEQNVATKSGSERVEFAIRLPGPDEDSSSVVYLPIDAKFPSEDYQRLLDAQEAADVDALAAAAKQLENAIKASARDICDKYIAPPATTDFGIMFLPTEGLYAEVIRRTGLVEFCQRDCRVVIAGPTTLAALLNSLQMGFRTLAIQKRSSEVWEILSAVKTEFGKFGDVLTRVKRKLEEASKTVDSAETRTRVMGKALRRVESMPSAPAAVMLGLGDDSDGDVSDNGDLGTETADEA
jgi:DNA recombination protein RmuC